MKNRALLAQFLLVFVTLLWGSTFLTLQIALQWADPIVIVAALRFILASLIVFCLLKGKLSAITRYEWRGGFFIGCCIFGVYTLQTIGLDSIPSSTSAFLTGLYVAFVPLLQWIVFKNVPRPITIVTIVLAFAGMTLFANPFSVSFSGQIGEWVTVLSALICAAEILSISYFAKGCLTYLHNGVGSDRQFCPIRNWLGSKIRLSTSCNLNLCPRTRFRRHYRLVSRGIFRCHRNYRSYTYCFCRVSQCLASQ